MSRYLLSNRQSDAVIAGLRLLQHALENHDPMVAEGSDIGAIVRCNGAILDVDEIDDLCQLASSQLYRGIYDEGE